MKQLAVQDAVHSSEPGSKQQVNRHHSICVKSVTFIFISNNNQKSYLGPLGKPQKFFFEKIYLSIYPNINIDVLSVGKLTVFKSFLEIFA